MEGNLGLAILTCFVWLCLYWKPRSGMVLQCNNISVTDERHTPGSPKWEEESCKTRPTFHSYFSKPDLKLEISPINKKPRMDDGTIQPDVFEFDNEEELNDNQSTNKLENGELIFFRNPFDNRTTEGKAFPLVLSINMYERSIYIQLYMREGIHIHNTEKTTMEYLFLNVFFLYTNSPSFKNYKSNKCHVQALNRK